MKKVIIFLVRKRLGLKKNQRFKFSNQKTDSLYYFTDINVMKVDERGVHGRSRVSLNWLLDDECQIEKINE